MSTYNFKNIGAPSNTQKGIAEFVYVAPLSYFASLGSPVAPFTNPGDKVTIKVAHTLKAGKFMFEAKLAPQKNSGTIAPTGDRGLSSFGNEITIFIPGTDAARDEQVEAMLNEGLVVIYRDIDCTNGLVQQIGNKCAPAYATPTRTTGTGADGNRGWNIVINADHGNLYYAPTTSAVADLVQPDDDEAG